MDPSRSNGQGSPRPPFPDNNNRRPGSQSGPYPQQGVPHHLLYASSIPMPQGQQAPTLQSPGSSHLPLPAHLRPSNPGQYKMPPNYPAPIHGSNRGPGQPSAPAQPTAPAIATRTPSLYPASPLHHDNRPVSYGQNKTIQGARPGLPPAYLSPHSQHQPQAAHTLTPQATPRIASAIMPTANDNSSPSQAPGTGGRPKGLGYGTIINSPLSQTPPQLEASSSSSQPVPQAVTPSPDQSWAPPTRNIFNGGPSPRFMPPKVGANRDATNKAREARTLDLFRKHTEKYNTGTGTPPPRPRAAMPQRAPPGGKPGNSNPHNSKRIKPPKLLKIPVPTLQWDDEPSHLPKKELVRIRGTTSWVIEPTVPIETLPKHIKTQSFGDAINGIKAMLIEATAGRVFYPLWKMRDLSDAIEVFVASKDRRPLTKKEREELLTVRYARIVEDAIIEGYLDIETVRDWNIMDTKSKNWIVREAWEIRERMAFQMGVYPQEVQREIATLLQSQ